MYVHLSTGHLLITIRTKECTSANNGISGSLIFLKPIYVCLEGLVMKNNNGEHPGMKLLLQRYKRLFGVPENINHYSKQDYEIAEKKFLRYSLRNNCV
jgi:hypothetical protein